MMQSWIKLYFCIFVTATTMCAHTLGIVKQWGKLPLPPCSSAVIKLHPVLIKRPLVAGMTRHTFTRSCKLILNMSKWIHIAFGYIPHSYFTRVILLVSTYFAFTEQQRLLKFGSGDVCTGEEECSSKEVSPTAISEIKTGECNFIFCFVWFCFLPFPHWKRKDFSLGSRRSPGGP